ncbi:hypothetical protein WEH80_31155 [Actinomycetes bacterium KLBMP 9759]
MEQMSLLDASFLFVEDDTTLVEPFLAKIPLVLRYRRRVHVGLTGDDDTVPDLAVLARGIEAGGTEPHEIATAPGGRG